MSFITYASIGVAVLIALIAALYWLSERDWGAPEFPEIEPPKPLPNIDRARLKTGR